MYITCLSETVTYNISVTCNNLTYQLVVETLISVYYACNILENALSVRNDQQSVASDNNDQLSEASGSKDQQSVASGSNIQQTEASVSNDQQSVSVVSKYQRTFVTTTTYISIGGLYEYQTVIYIFI